MLMFLHFKSMLAAMSFPSIRSLWVIRILAMSAIQRVDVCCSVIYNKHHRVESLRVWIVCQELRITDLSILFCSFLFIWISLKNSRLLWQKAMNFLQLSGRRWKRYLYIFLVDWNVKGILWVLYYYLGWVYIVVILFFQIQGDI